MKTESACKYLSRFVDRCVVIDSDEYPEMPEVVNFAQQNKAVEYGGLYFDEGGDEVGQVCVRCECYCTAGEQLLTQDELEEFLNDHRLGQHPERW